MTLFASCSHVRASAALSPYLWLPDGNETTVIFRFMIPLQPHFLTSAFLKECVFFVILFRAELLGVSCFPLLFYRNLLRPCVRICRYTPPSEGHYYFAWACLFQSASLPRAPDSATCSFITIVCGNFFFVIFAHWTYGRAAYYLERPRRPCKAGINFELRHPGFNKLLIV